MSKLKEIFATHRYAIIWSVCYFALTWFILKFLFNFDMFSMRYWHRLMHASLHGFAGFVFGIMLLAALPLYIATTSIIIRTKKPLIKIPTPKFISATENFIRELYAPAPDPAAPTPDAPAAPAPVTEPDAPVSNNIPVELQAMFARARNSSLPLPPAQKNLVPVGAGATTTTGAMATQDLTTENDLPLPSDFDFTDIPDTDSPFGDAPQFTAIDFDADDGNDGDDNATQMIPAMDSDQTPHGVQSVIDYLTAHGHTPTNESDIVISDNMAIAVHDDADFWIADPENWFAAGQQKASPVLQLVTIHNERGLRPILYLASTNIMDIDNCRDEWTKMGITIISDLSELPV